VPSAPRPRPPWPCSGEAEAFVEALAVAPGVRARPGVGRGLPSPAPLATAPEVCDYVGSFEVVALIVEALDALAERLAELAARADGPSKSADAPSAPPLSEDRQARRGPAGGPGCLTARPKRADARPVIVHSLF
jgi:hypothetical protein